MRVRLSHPTGSLSSEVSGSMVLGRPGGGADLVVPDAGLSRRHGRLWTEGSSVWYEDLGSANGSWVGTTRQEGPLRLAPGLEVTVGHTSLSLEIPEGMQLQLEGQAGSQDLTSASLIAALYAMVERLLSSAGALRDVLERLAQEIPVARRIALVGWPPAPDGTWPELCAPQGSSFVSKSLAGYAVERGRALLFAEWARPGDLELPPSAVFQGIRNAAYVPLSWEGEVLGLLCADSPEALLTEEHFQFICAVAGLLATSLASERLREEARLRQLEAQRIEARREALVAFLKIASHDLKNPLHAIANGARLLGVARSEQHPELIRIILDASGRATDLIEAYLDIAAIEGGHSLELELAQLDPRSLVEEEFHFLRAARGEGMPLISWVNEVDCGPIRADERKLRQILANLISNALKYSPRGGRLRVRTQGRVRFSVEDQGLGISAADQQRLFAGFQRVGDRALASGSGLGLWLSAALVEAHGGQIGVESQPGRGSTFWFTVPQE